MGIVRERVESKAVKNEITFKKDVAPFFAIIFGALMAAFSVSVLLLPNNAMDYGTAGLAIIISKLTNWNLSITVFAVFLPFLILGCFKLGFPFFLKTLVGSLAYTVGLELFEGINLEVEHLLSVTFGGAVLGIGLSLILKFGGCIDGSEIFANVLIDELNKRRARKLSSMSGILLGFNACVYLIGAITINVESAMLSILTYFIATFIVDNVTDHFEAIKKVTIVTDQYMDIVSEIKDKMNKTSTVTKSFGVIHGDNNTIVCYVNYFELPKLKKIIEASDCNAFVTVATVDEMYVNRKKS